MIVSKLRPPPRRLLLACVCALGFLGGTQTARAGTIVQASLDGVNWTTEASSTGDLSAAIHFSLGTFVVDISSVLSNAPGTPDLANSLTSTLSIKNNGGDTGVGQPATLYLLFGASGFTAPQGNVTAATGLGGTFSTGSGTVTNLAWVNQTAGGIAGSGGLSGVEIGPQSANYNGGTYDTGTAKVGATLSGGFALNQVVKIQDGSAGGGQLNFSGNITLTPEPSSLALLSIGLVGVAGYVWRRRRMASVESATLA